MQRPNLGKKMMSKDELRNAVHHGIEASVKEMMEFGEYDDEEKGAAPLLCLQTALRRRSKAWQTTSSWTSGSALELVFVVDRHADVVGETAATGEEAVDKGARQDDVHGTVRCEISGTGDDAFKGGGWRFSVGVHVPGTYGGPALFGCYLSSPHTVNQCAEVLA